jgi:hypothetical protein
LDPIIQDQRTYSQHLELTNGPNKARVLAVASLSSLMYLKV